MVDYLMEQPNVVPRMNPLILSTDRQYLDFTANPGDLCCSSLPFYYFSTVYILHDFLSLLLSCFTVVDDWEDATMFSYLDSKDKTAVMAKRMKYFKNSGKYFMLSLINTILDLIVSFSITRSLETI